MELIGHVARWKRHLIKLIDIPACEEKPPRSRVGPDCFHQLGDLVVAFFLATVKISFDQFIARPIHPLSAIDGAKITPFPCEFLIFHDRSEEHTSELQSLMRISYAVFCLKKKKVIIKTVKHKPI